MYQQDDSMSWVHWLLLLIVAVFIVFYMMTLQDSRSAAMHAEIKQARAKQASAEKDIDMLLRCFNGKVVLVVAGERTKRRCKLEAASW